jgi:hypothetical protein
MKPNLPPFASRLVGLIGRRLAMALMAHIHGTGGTGWVRIPRRVKPSHKLVGIIGHAAAEKLASEFGAQVVRFPQCQGMHLSRRNEEIRRLVAAGVPRKEIARRYGLTVRRVRGLVAATSSESA